MGHYFLDTHYIKWATQSWSHIIYPRSSDSFYIISYYIKWVTTSWTYSSKPHLSQTFV